MDCVFCKIINGEIPSYKIYEDDLTYAFLDISGEGYGHTLVVPKKHFKNILECNQKYLNACLKTANMIASHYIKDCGFSGFNLFVNTGASAGQSVEHLHIHIIPRKANDGILPWNIKKDATHFEKVRKFLEVK